MRVVLQRVQRARVDTGDQCLGRIGAGLLLLVGIRKGDTREDVSCVADKIANLRIFEDEQGKMNRSLIDVGGSVLSVSQFTLYGDVSHGRRPGFAEAERPEAARPLYHFFNDYLRQKHRLNVETGQFGANMAVSLINDGPVTLIVESKKTV